MNAKLAYLCGSQSWGGLEMNHVRNARWMADRGHDVCFICVKGSPVDSFAQELAIPVHHIQPHRKYYDYKRAGELAVFLRNHHFTHLLIRASADLSLTAHIKFRLGSSIFTAYFMEMQLGVARRTALHSLRFKYIDLWSCPLYWLKDEVVRMGRFHNRLEVIPSGIDLSHFSVLPSKIEARNLLKLPQEGLIFGLIGRFDPKKGQLLLLEAMKLAKNKDFLVLLLGEPTRNEGDQYYSQMTSLIENEGLANRVLIRPFMKEVQYVYTAIDWFVMATKAETFGMVTIESLACGTPVLGSNAGGTPEILIRSDATGGLLFETQNPLSLANKIDYICTTNTTISKESLFGIAAFFSHEKVCEQVEKVLCLDQPVQ